MKKDKLNEIYEKIANQEAVVDCPQCGEVEARLHLLLSYHLVK